MKRKMMGPVVIVALSSLLLMCDAGNVDLLINAASHQANTLKSFCQQNDLRAPEISKADSLVSLASLKQRRGQKEQAFTALDLAVIYYKLAFSKQEMQKTEQRVETAGKQLADDEEQLRTYSTVLAELKGENK